MTAMEEDEVVVIELGKDDSKRGGKKKAGKSPNLANYVLQNIRTAKEIFEARKKLKVDEVKR